MVTEKRKLGRPFNTVKYSNPFNNELLGVYEYRKLHYIYKTFFKQSLYPKRIKIDKLGNKCKGRPKGTFKYEDKEGNLIGVLEWRKINKWKKNFYNKETRNHRIIHKIKIDSIKYNQDFNYILELKSKCAICGFDKWFVDIHHKDYNNKNNSKDNLIGLCPTCHLGIHRRYVVLNDEGKYIINPQNSNLLEISINYLKK